MEGETRFLKPGGTSGKEPPLPIQETPETQVRFLGWEDALVEEMATQYSCLENFMDRGACRATVHGVAKSQLNNFHFQVIELTLNPFD